MPYKVLTREQLQEARRRVIDEVTSVTGVSDDEAARALRSYKW